MQGQLLRYYPAIRYLSLPHFLLLSKHFSILDVMPIYLCSPRGLWAQWGRNGSNLSLVSLCFAQGLACPYLLMEWRSSKRELSSTILISENQLTLCTGHLLGNWRDMPLPRHHPEKLILLNFILVTLSAVLQNDPKRLAYPYTPENNDGT